MKRLGYRNQLYCLIVIVSAIRDRKQLAHEILIIFYMIEIRFTGNIGTTGGKIPGQLARKSDFKTNQLLSTSDILGIIQIGQDFVCSLF